MRTPVRARRTPSLASRADRRARTSSGCGRGGDARPSRSSSPRPSQRSRGSSRIDRPRPAQTSAAQRHPPSRLHSPSPSFAHNGGWRHSRRRIRAPATPRKSGSGSAALAPALRRSPPTADRVALSIFRVSGAAAPDAPEYKKTTSFGQSLRPYGDRPYCGTAPQVMRAISLIDLPWDKNTRALSDRSSPTSIPPPPASCQSRQPNKSKIAGSILDVLTHEYIFEPVASFAETEFQMSQLGAWMAPIEAPAPRALAGVGLIISDCLV